MGLFCQEGEKWGSQPNFGLVFYELWSGGPQLTMIFKRLTVGVTPPPPIHPRRPKGWNREKA